MHTTNITPPPGYTTTKPLIGAISTMWSELGKQDACIQLQELSNRCLHDALVASGKSPDDYLKPLFASYGIPNGTYSLAELEELVAKSYLVQTYSQLERMLRGVIAHYKTKYASTGAIWATKNSKDERYSPLEELHANLPKASAKALKDCPEFDLLEYYRVVRVANSHVKGTTLSRAQADYKKLTTKQLQHFSTCYSLKAPNPPSLIAFDDFLLFTRATKYFAKQINEVCA